MLSHQPIHRFRFSLLIPLLMLVVGPALAADGLNNVFWFRSDNTKGNFYTISPEERNQVFEFYRDSWNYQGAVWAAYSVPPDTDAKPVYRFYSENPTEYLFTISENQKNRLIANGRGWIYDGIAWYAYDYPRADTVPIYLVNLGLRNERIYTLDSPELRDVLARSLANTVTGIAWYAYVPNPYIDPVPMAPVTGGCFDLGYQGNGTPWVCVDDFQMGRYEVTQALWEAIMGEDPARWFYACDDCPVENVTWHEAQDFVERLNQVTHRAYRLPTEAEWEYACRSGGLAQTYCGGEDIDALAWYAVNAGGYPHEVGRKAPNGLGLYDMSGNVVEWTCSNFQAGYLDAAVECGLSVSQGYRVVRGGSWDQEAAASSSTARLGLTPATQSPSIGLRLAHD
ncbi:SUMF1/EgtB/PvdO family nonheme iron enzyme [Rhabdochromatium marinum]|uniref:SUMF1/EgtB/PvdO family nonheme iron enzyme n=1 Tax=Rhabdochromatium marinum TaxID=48729 RepID=UPI0019041435|nr:SUMF1/EgtB/PvdO family nonheme iron enzyme [Rhabdochromatium marinum]